MVPFLDVSSPVKQYSLLLFHIASDLYTYIERDKLVWKTNNIEKKNARKRGERKKKLIYVSSKLGIQEWRQQTDKTAAASVAISFLWFQRSAKRFNKRTRKEREILP